MIAAFNCGSRLAGNSPRSRSSARRPANIAFKFASACSARNLSSSSTSTAETFQPPRKWAEQAYAELFYWNEAEHGGHFAAFEQPQIFAREMWRAFARFR